jgi:cytochrome c peroxidase
VRALVHAQADSLDAALTRLDASLAPPIDSMQVRQRFAEARRAYKQVEPVLEFYAPAVASALNARRQEVDDDDAPPPSTMAASGFPALEAALWPRVTPIGAAQARRDLVAMRSSVQRIRVLGDAVQPTTAQLLEVARQALARVSTLGIAGFDTPVTKAALAESADALEGVRTLLAAEPTRWRAMVIPYQQADRALAVTIAALRSAPDFETFARIPFLAYQAIPAAHAVEALRRASGTTPIAIQRFWRAEVASPYDVGAFDPQVFAAGDAPTPTPALIALGARLFNEPMLSGTGTRACASCHVPSRVFADGLVRQPRLDRAGLVARHTPTLLNASLTNAYFADGRAPSLEEQVVRVLESASEMGSSIEQATARLSRLPSYRTDFARAFGGPDSTAVTAVHLRQTLAAYERTLVGLNARFDRAVRGDPSQLTAAEQHGFDVFMGKAGCGTCHFAPLFNGTTPPLYRSADVEVIGVPAAPERPRVVDADAGRGAVDRQPIHHGAFKTPTLRNVTLTAPYFHHGTFPTLRAVLTFYERGGGQGSGAHAPNQTLSSLPLHLTPAERRDLEAFLGSLVDTAGLGTRR